MGFGEWPRVRDMVGVVELPTIVAGTIYRNTTPYPQFLFIPYTSEVQADGGSLFGSSIISFEFGPSSPPTTYGVDGGIDGISLQEAGTPSYYVRIKGALSAFIPPGWYWRVRETYNGGGLQPVWGVILQAPVASGY